MDNLLKEGKEKNKIHMVGNTMIDSLVNFNNSIQKSNILKKIEYPETYGLMTFHRPSNVDSKETLIELLKIIEKCCSSLTMVLPLHPRTKKSLEKHNFWDQFKVINNLIFPDSLGYLDFMKLVTNADIVITDSGGIQEETTYLQIPCITVRENTERPITITLGNNELIELDATKISERMIEKLNNSEIGEIPPLWDGHATERILDVIANS